MTESMSDELAAEVNEISTYLGGRGTRVIGRTPHRDADTGEVLAVTQEYETADGRRFSMTLARVPHGAERGEPTS